MIDTCKRNQSPVIFLVKLRAFVFGHNDAFIPAVERKDILLLSGSEADCSLRIA